MTECKYGCAREQLIEKSVRFELAAGDAADLLLEAIRANRERRLRDRAIEDEIAAAPFEAELLSIHRDLARVLAEDANDVFRICGAIEGLHVPFSRPALINEADAIAMVRAPA